MVVLKIFANYTIIKMYNVILYKINKLFVTTRMDTFGYI